MVDFSFPIKVFKYKREDPSIKKFEKNRLLCLIPQRVPPLFFENFDRNFGNEPLTRNQEGRLFAQFDLALNL